MGCAKGPGSAAASAGEPNLTLSTPTTVVRPGSARSIEDELAAGERLLAEGRYDTAAEHFQTLVEAAQKPSERLRALWGQATAADLGGHPSTAVDLYSRYVAEAPRGRDRARAGVRVVRLLRFLERYEEAAARARRINQRELPELSQIALLSAIALWNVQAGDLEGAELAIGRARQLIERHGYERLPRVPLDVAAVYFALGELRRVRAEAIRFHPLPPDFLAELERRCQWILDAQSAYSTAMKGQDAHWSSMAGVRVSELYHELHRDLTQIDSPDAETAAERQLFEGAMRLRYSILLRKAVSMLRATVALQERTVQSGAWVVRARESLEEMERAEQAEEAAIDALPYSRDQLQQVLDRMASQGRNSSAP